MFYCLLCLSIANAAAASHRSGTPLRSGDDERPYPPFGLTDSSQPSSSSSSSSTRPSSDLETPNQQMSPDELLTPSSDEAFEITEKLYLRGDWCKTQPLKQRIEEEGCISKVVTNRFCYGQCNSFFIPKQANSYTDSFQSCSFCKPYRVNYITVTLRCPGQPQRIRRKRIQRVKECRCMAVTVTS